MCTFLSKTSYRPHGRVRLHMHLIPEMHARSSLRRASLHEGIRTHGHLHTQLAKWLRSAEEQVLRVSFVVPTFAASSDTRILFLRLLYHFKLLPTCRSPSPHVKNKSCVSLQRRATSLIELQTAVNS